MKEKKTYCFDELSPEAQQYACEHYAESICTDDYYNGVLQALKEKYHLDIAFYADGTMTDD